MNENISNWDDLRLFLAVARGGGLSAAAAVTGKSAPTLGRRMLALERSLGRELFERLPRGYRLTGEGRDLLERLQEIEDRLAGIGPPETGPAPVVKVSAGRWMSFILCRDVARLVVDGDIRLRFISADHMLDMRRREAVIGIRNQRPEQVGLACRRIGRIGFAVYGVDEAVTTWARVIGPTPSALWLAERTSQAPAIEVTDPRNALDLAVAGSAKAVLPTVVGDTIAGLKRLSGPIADLAHDQWLVTHDDERFEPHVRTAIDRITALLADTT